MNILELTMDSGYYHCTAEGMDWAISYYLPNSVQGLREIAAERVGVSIEEMGYDKIHTVTEFLFILADGMGTDYDPFEVYGTPKA